jgi:hypothetical protein
MMESVPNGRLGVVSDLEDAVDVGISGGSISGQLSFFTLVSAKVVSAKVTCPRKEGTVCLLIALSAETVYLSNLPHGFGYRNCD